MTEQSENINLGIITNNPIFKNNYPKTCFDEDIENSISLCSIELSTSQINEIKYYAWLSLVFYVSETEEFDETRPPLREFFQLFNYGVRKEEKKLLEELTDTLSKLAVLSKKIPSIVLCTIEAKEKVKKTGKSVKHNSAPSFFDYDNLMSFKNATNDLLNRRSKLRTKKITIDTEAQKDAISRFLYFYISHLIGIIRQPPKSGHSYNRNLEELIKSTFVTFRAYHVPLSEYETQNGDSLPLRVKVRKIMTNAWSV